MRIEFQRLLSLRLDAIDPDSSLSGLPAIINDINIALGAFETRYNQNRLKARMRQVIFSRILLSINNLFVKADLDINADNALGSIARQWIYFNGPILTSNISIMWEIGGYGDLIKNHDSFRLHIDKMKSVPWKFTGLDSYVHAIVDAHAAAAKALGMSVTKKVTAGMALMTAATEIGVAASLMACPPLMPAALVATAIPTAVVTASSYLLGSGGSSLFKERARKNSFRDATRDIEATLAGQISDSLVPEDRGRLQQILQSRGGR
jgi:hypothetical protein